jgi:hypothetical protein
MTTLFLIASPCSPLSSLAFRLRLVDFYRLYRHYPWKASPEYIQQRWSLEKIAERIPKCM